MKEIATTSSKKNDVKTDNSVLQANKAESFQSRHSSADRVLFLQRTIGNQAVQRMVRSGALQAKLRIGQPGDRYEQEADRVADAVMRMPEPQAASFSPHHIQLVCPTCKEDKLRRQPIEEEEELQMQPKEEEEEELLAKAISGNLSEVNPYLESHFHSLKGGGQPLSENDRAFFEPRFGRDFDQVQVHTDAQAAESAKAVNAQAFTVEKEVIFGAGQYSPGTNEGRKLMAHELTHIVQQEGTKQSIKKTSSPYIQRFSAEEHMQFGDVTGIMIDIGGGVELTFGQVIALGGDEFGDVDKLIESTKTAEGRAMIRAHLEKEKIGGNAVQNLPSPTSKQKRKAEKDYQTLASENTSHFLEGGTALETWLSHHSRAIDLAVQGGMNMDRSLLNEAFFIEAFGQHFLTDAFSSGHIRVPRREIINYYTTEFAPNVFNHLIDHLKDRLIDEIYDQVEQQTWINEAAWFVGFPIGGLYVRKKIRDKIKNKIEKKIKEIGDRSELIRYLGLGLAGIVSGAIHDKENKSGLWVVSNFQPQAWAAFGDSELESREPKTWEQRGYIERAVLASAEDIQKAYMIGVDEGQNLWNLLPPDQIPSEIRFEFDSHELVPLAESAIFDLANYLNYNPDTEVTLIGHTDPIGRDAYNYDLGTRRVKSVVQHLRRLGIDENRLANESMGEELLATDDPKKYHLNRRVTLTYMSVQVYDNQGPNELAYKYALQKVLGEIGPPFEAEDYLPYLAEGFNVELPKWKWGSIPEWLRIEMANWIKGYEKTIRKKTLNLEKETIDSPIGEFTVDPGPIAERILDDLFSDPIEFLEDAIGKSAGP